VDMVDANHFAVALLGDAIYTNPFRARLRMAKGLGAANLSVADARNRTEQRADREEPCGIRMGSPCRA
ncbi:hypothetical protein, partial [Paraburkholderia sp. BL23I1N1]|uniref:hypothetical protein n=1 Tax=Paraburkholderia sp. BL23I1N1 TaxID=1938802 RepID=UPI002877D3AD